MNKIVIEGKQNFMGIEIPIINGGFGEGRKSITDKTIAEIHNMKIKHVREAVNKKHEKI